MIKVDNRKTVAELARKVYRSNRKRNLLLIAAIILTTLLFTTIFSIGIRYWNEVSERSIQMEGIKFDIQLSEPTPEQTAAIRSMDKVLYAGVAVKCAIVEKSGSQAIDKLQLFWVDETCWEKQCLPAFTSITGTYPTGESEVILSEQTLKAMGIADPEVGMEIPVTYYNLNAAEGGKSIEKEIRLSGYYKDYTGDMRGYVSKKFFESTGAKQTDFTQGYLKITLKNPFYTMQEILDMQNEIGLVNNQYMDADYDTIQGFIKTAVGLSGLLLMILLSGYLFIYNTMYLSIAGDIRFYGQLKTIGMTSRQMKGLVYRQAFWNSLIGIPAGMAAGVFVSHYVVPNVLQMVYSASDKNSSVGDWNPAVYIGTVFFAVFTVFISSLKPAKAAGSCSPIEAAGYAGRVPNRKARKSRNGSTLSGMAWYNLIRDKKQLVIILASYVVALSVFLTVNVVVRENDAAWILNQTSTYDLRILNDTTLEENLPYLTEDTVKSIEKLPGVKEARRVISAEAVVPYQEDSLREYFTLVYQSRYSPGNYDDDMEVYRKEPDNERFTTRFVGIEESEFDRINKNLGGTLDKEDFISGRTAVVNPFMGISADGMVGKELGFYLPDGKNPDREHKVMIVAAVGSEFNPAYFAGGYTPAILVSTQYAENILKNPYVELIEVSYEKPLNEILEKELKGMFEDNDSLFFESKLDRYLEMVPSENKIKTLGRGMAVLLAVLAVMNYCNMIAAGAQSRKKEFAALNSIGMTISQQRKVLMLEGLGYGLWSVGLTLLFGIPLSFLVFDGMNQYGIAYSFPVLDNVLLFLVVLAVCVLVPPAAQHFVQKGSVTERLREIS